MFRNLLVGYDGSGGAEPAVRKATEIAVMTESRHHGLLEASLSMGGKSLARDAGGRKTRAYARSGPVARSIVSLAERRGADSIIAGSRGPGSMQQYSWGSVSPEITGLAQCPVLVDSIQ